MVGRLHCVTSRCVEERDPHNQSLMLPKLASLIPFLYAVLYRFKGRHSVAAGDEVWDVEGTHLMIHHHAMVWLSVLPVGLICSTSPP